MMIIKPIYNGPINLGKWREINMTKNDFFIAIGISPSYNGPYKTMLDTLYEKKYKNMDSFHLFRKRINKDDDKNIEDFLEVETSLKNFIYFDDNPELDYRTSRKGN